MGSTRRNWVRTVASPLTARGVSRPGPDSPAFKLRWRGPVFRLTRAILSAMEAWETFAVIVGSSAAALLGLLFVAVSIRVDVIAGSPELRNRAAQTLGLFVMLLFIALLLALPGQKLRLLGAELIGLTAVTAAVLYLLDRRARSGASGQPVGRLLDIVTPNAATSVLLLASAVVLAIGHMRGSTSSSHRFSRRSPAG
jgi:hypothetical protein